MIDFEQFASRCDEEAPALRAQRVALNLRRDRLRGLDPEEWGDAWRSIDEGFERLAERVKDWTARAKCVKMAETGKARDAVELWRWREREKPDFLLLERWMR